MANVFSLTTVSVVITNPIYGQITIGGAGKMVGSVGYAYNADAFSMEHTPDGGYVANFNNDKSGEINLSIKQTSSHIQELTDFINWCRSNPVNAMSTLKITDPLGNIAASASGVLPTKIPDNQVGESLSDRQFKFLAGEINSEERTV